MSNILKTAPFGGPPREGGAPSLRLPVNEHPKTPIPFLRQLTAMLKNDNELVLFVPGTRLPNGEIKCGKIVVRDRERVQSEVLPVYFNHASFASFRRQLSYFSFVREGNIRKISAAYTNDLVVELEDILKLKRRRGPVSQPPGEDAEQQQEQQQQTEAQKCLRQELQADRGQEQESQLETSPADVTSALLSGTLRAAKTNHGLDSEVKGRLPGISVAFQTGSATQSSLSRSLSQSESSSSSSDIYPEDKRSSGMKNKYNRGSRGAGKPKVFKRKARSFIKHTITRRERKRCQRLMTINSIVPFIYLPPGRIIPKKEEGECVGKATTEGGTNPHLGPHGKIA